MHGLRTQRWTGEWGCEGEGIFSEGPSKRRTTGFIDALRWFSYTRSVLSVLLLCSACSTQKLSQADREFLKNQPSLTVVHEQTTPFIVTTPNGSGTVGRYGSTDPLGAATVMGLSILCCSKSGGTEIDRVKYDTARELRDRFLNRLVPGLPGSLVVHRANPVPEIPDDADGMAMMIRKGMVLAFKVKGTDMTIWYKPSLTLHPQTKMHSYLASLAAEASLTYSETPRTLWRRTCHVKTNIDLPDGSVRALFEPENPSFKTIIDDLVDQCTDELWRSFNGSDPAGTLSSVPK